MIEILIPRISIGPKSSSLLIDYLKHALATRLISVSAFCQTLYQQFLQEVNSNNNNSGRDQQRLHNFMKNNALFSDYIHMFELIAPQLWSSDLLKQLVYQKSLEEQHDGEELNRTFPAASDASGNGVVDYSPALVKQFVVSFQRAQHSDWTEVDSTIDYSVPTTPSNRSNKRKRTSEETREEKGDEITDEHSAKRMKYEVTDEQQTTKDSTVNLDREMTLLTNNVNVCVLMLMKYSIFAAREIAHSQTTTATEQTGAVDSQKDSDDSNLMKSLVNQLKTEDLMKNLAQCAQLLSKLFNNERIQLLIRASRAIQSQLWLMTKQCLEEEFITTFDLVLQRPQVSSQPLVSYMNQLWNTTLYLLSYLSCADNSAYQPQDFVPKTVVSNMRSPASASISLIVNAEVFTNDLKRTCIETSFQIFDQLRQLKQMNLTNFFVELVLCTLRIMHSVPTSAPNKETLDFVDTHNLITLNLYKSFLLSKVPLLFKRWIDTYSNDKKMYYSFIRSISAKGEEDNVPIDHITDCIKRLKQFPNLYLLSQGSTIENVLLQFAYALVDFELISVNTLNMLIPENLQLPSIEGEAAKLINTFAESLDITILSESVLLFRAHHGIVDQIVSNVSSPTHRDILLNFICLSPTLLDVIHLHGKTLDLIEKLLASFKTIFEGYHGSAERETDALLKLHEQFSEIFSVLFLIIQRFQIITNKQSRELFFNLLKVNMCSDINDAQESLSRVINWINGWFHELDMLPEGNTQSDESLCPIGDELIAALLDLQTQQLPSDANPDPQTTTLNFDKLQDIKSRFSPCQILEVTPYVVEQCQYVYSERDMNALVSTQMLGFFVNFFGKYCDISVSVSLKNSLHRVFKKTDSPDSANGVTLVTQMYSSNVWSSHQFGYNMGSSIIHSILQSNIHFVNKNIQDTDVEPIIRDYDPQLNIFLHRLLQDEYTTTRKTLKYQLSHTTTSLPIVETPSTDPLLVYNILLPNTNHKLGNEIHDLVTKSTCDSTPILQAFERAFSNLISHRRSANLPSTIFGSRHRSNSSPPNSFEILQTVLRIGGIRQFIHFIVNYISSHIQKEDDDIQEPVFIAEISALVLGITAGKSGIQYLFQVFMPTFLHNWLLLNKTQIKSRSQNSSMERIMKLHHYHHTAQVFAHFSVIASFYGEFDIFEQFLANQCSSLLSASSHPRLVAASGLPTLYYLVQTMQICSTIPSLLKRFSPLNATKFAELASRFNGKDSIRVLETGKYHPGSNKLVYGQPPSWVSRFFNLATVEGRHACLLFYAGSVEETDMEEVPLVA